MPGMTTKTTDFGLADPDFWAYFRTLSQTPEEQAWHDATKALYQAKRQEAYDAAKADIMVGVAKTKSGKFTMAHHERAIATAKGTFGIWRAAFEATTPDFGGVRNPHYGKPDLWGATTVETVSEDKGEVEALAEWLATQTWSEFAISLATQYRQRGSLSPRQVEAARSMKAKADAREAARKADKPETGLDLSNLPSGMYAVPGGDTRLKVRVSRSRNASASGRYPAGTIFVNDDAAYGARKMYGSQKPGEAYKGDIVEALTIIAADPKAAVMAYGRLVGVCGACGRRLEDEASIEAGIGPVCAAKF